MNCYSEKPLVCHEIIQIDIFFKDANRNIIVVKMTKYIKPILTTLKKLLRAKLPSTLNILTLHIT